MFSEYILPKEILDNFVPNYKINLVTAEDIEDINHFCTDLQYIFGMLKCRKSKEKLVSYTNENSEYFIVLMVNLIWQLVNYCIRRNYLKNQ